MISAVPLPTPDIDSMVEALERLTERVKAGEVCTLLITAFTDDRSFVSLERGKRLHRLKMIGLLESWKFDLLQSMEDGVPVELL